MIMNGSLPSATASGSGASGDSRERSCSQAKKRRNGRRLLGDVVADRPPQHRIPGFQGVEDGALRGRTFDRQLHLLADARQDPQMGRERDADHGSVWTSTESTAGRSRTMGAQVSPLSADAYTCPPVVPK